MVYKPHYACLCQKGERRFFRILDAEIKDRNFMLDIKFRELTFMDKDAANDRIDPALFSLRILRRQMSCKAAKSADADRTERAPIFRNRIKR